MLRDRVTASNSGNDRAIAMFCPPLPGYPREGFVIVYRLDPRGRIAHQWVLPAG